MRQEFLFLAEGAEAVGGKIYILGGGVDYHQAPAFPVALNVDIALGFLTGWGETNRPIDLQVKVVDEDEKDVFVAGAEITVGRPPQARPGQDIRSLIAIRGPFPLEKPGAYKAVMLLNGEPQEPPFRFWADLVRVPTKG